MAFVTGSIRQLLSKPANGLKRVDFSAQFSTTSTTGELPCQLQVVKGYSLNFTSAPNTRTEINTINLGTLSATGAAQFIAPPYAGTLVHAKIAVTTTVATDDTNYWTFRLINKGNSDADMILATDANTNKATGGSAITAYTPRTLTRHGTAANYAFTASDDLYFTATKTASGVNLVNATLQLGFDIGSPGERLYFNETFTNGQFTRTASVSSITVTRDGGNPSSGATISGSYWGY